MADQWLERPGALTSKALLDLLDPGLERSHVLLQLCEGVLEDLAPAALVGEPRLDPAQGLRDRVVLLLESLKSVIDRIEVSEHLLSQLGEPEVHPTEPAVDLGELTSQEFNELLVLGRGHGPCLSQVQTVCKCGQVWTDPASSGHITCQQQRRLGRRFDLIPAIWQDVRGGHAVHETFGTR
ncbi:MAG TPA: hypothetical protein VGV06_03785 [Methylomirabilota bacterium]|nr:hypothetical protein [Methylomirabilota bacterium]